MSKLWGGRFSKETNKLVEEFTKSIHFDYKLAKADVVGSMIHVVILGKANYLESHEVTKLIDGLKEIFHDLDNPEFSFDKDCEDIHTNIQKLLESKVGDLVLKLHTARSRNDQVVFATKAYCREEIESLIVHLNALSETISKKAKDNEALIIPGFTHMQHAQPVYLKDYLMVYVEMLSRDKGRLDQVYKSIKLSLGAGALAGTPILNEHYNIEANELINEKELKKDAVEQLVNSLDVVSDRDFVIETISVLSILAMHLSRLAEDLIVWCTKEFDFIELDDAFCTGSSLMPQKKNPDVLELVRGYTGRLYGNLVNVLTVMKGLPLTYNRDMQLDKEPLFDSFEIVSKELRVLKGLIETIKFNEDKIKKHLDDESFYFTDLVYYLVGKGVPFKEAHTKVGELVRHAIRENTEVKKLPEDYLKEKLSPKVIKKEIEDLFHPQISVDSKRSVKRNNFSILKNPPEK